MAWQFLCVDGADAKRVFPLPNQGVVIIGGSHKHCDLCLHDLYVGRVHCQIDIDEAGDVWVTDQNPLAGTFVNKVKIEKQVLRNGDILRVGNTHLRLEPLGATPITGATGDAETEEVADAVEVIEDQGGPAPLVTPDRLGELVGYTIGHFLLDEVIHTGPYKTIFRATDQKSGQPVSLKVLSPRFPANIAELQHFSTVMKRALSLRHAHLVAMLGAGRSGHYTWIAREYIEGKSLTDVLAKLAGHVKPKWQSGLRLLKELAQALHYLHRQPLVHGNITPHNILIREVDKQAKLANVMIEPALAGSQLSQTVRPAKVEQDVAWVAPEQTRDEAFADRHADLYSLGAVVYARLTGRPPFQGKTLEETRKAIRTKPLTPPMELNAKIPEPLNDIVVKLLEKKPRDRYDEPMEVLADIEEVEDLVAAEE